MAQQKRRLHMMRIEYGLYHKYDIHECQDQVSSCQYTR